MASREKPDCCPTISGWPDEISRPYPPFALRLGSDPLRTGFAQHYILLLGKNSTTEDSQVHHLPPDGANRLFRPARASPGRRGAGARRHAGSSRTRRAGRRGERRWIGARRIGADAKAALVGLWGPGGRVKAIAAVTRLGRCRRMCGLATPAKFSDRFRLPCRSRKRYSGCVLIVMVGGGRIPHQRMDSGRHYLSTGENRNPFSHRQALL